MSDADFEFKVGEYVRAVNGRDGVNEQLSRISGKPVYLVRTERVGCWYMQAALSRLHRPDPR